MPTARPSDDLSKPRHKAPGPARKSPLPLRPLHRIWRRTLDIIDLTRIDLPVRGLGESHRGVTACQISDFHLDRDEDLERLVLAVEAINRQNPDLVFLTGDYFSGPNTMQRYVGAFRETLARLAPRTGIFAILGNHDHWSSADRVAEALRAAGADVLANESRRLHLRGDALAVVGIDDLWSRHAEPARAFGKVRPGDPTVVLAHNPDTALYARALKPGVMLSGHTHGGVIRIPYYGSPFRSILRIGKQFCAGLNLYDNFYIYTNRGLGTFWLRIRFNCRPEVSRFSLVPLADAPPQHAAGHKMPGAAKPAHHTLAPGREPPSRRRKRV